MCTHFNLRYACNHSKFIHRCVKNGFLISNVPSIVESGSHIDSKICSHEYVITGRLADDCIDCKAARGVVPGTGASGLESWLDWRGSKCTQDFVVESHGFQRVETLHPNLLNGSNKTVHHGTKRTQEITENVYPSYLHGFKSAIGDSRNTPRPGDAPFEGIGYQEVFVEDETSRFNLYNSLQSAGSLRQDSSKEKSGERGDKRKDALDLPYESPITSTQGRGCLFP